METKFPYLYFPTFIFYSVQRYENEPQHKKIVNGKQCMEIMNGIEQDYFSLQSTNHQLLTT